ncbi:MAG: helix-turn-helix domain-containing protein [Parvibaculaceae bacterium]|nr:helix-turn-helix domain-containing protein [Parvibaculaceae bacterium]
MKETISRRMAELGIDNIRKLERAAGVKKDVIGNMLRGRSKSVRSESLPGIAEALHISIPELLTGARTDDHAPAWETLDVRRASDDLNSPDSSEQIGFALEAGYQPPSDKSDFALRIEDDTMAPTICRGDLAFIRRVDSPCTSHDTDRSNICLIETKHSGLRVRRLATRLSDGKIDIHTDNGDYADEVGIDAASISVYGTVEYLLKRL